MGSERYLHFELPAPDGNVSSFQKPGDRFAGDVGIDDFDCPRFVQPQHLREQPGADSPAPETLVHSQLGDIPGGGFERAVPDQPLPGKGPERHEIFGRSGDGFGTVLPRGPEIPKSGNLFTIPGIDPPDRIRALEHLCRNLGLSLLLREIVEFARDFESEFPVDRDGFGVVLEDLQQVSADAGLLQIRDGMFENPGGETLPPVGFEGPGSRVVGRPDAVVIPDAVQREGGDSVAVERRERQPGRRTPAVSASCGAAPRLSAPHSRRKPAKRLRTGCRNRCRPGSGSPSVRV